MLGYSSEMNRLVLCDKELNIVSYNLNLSILEYQTAVMRQDFETADKVDTITSRNIFKYYLRLKMTISYPRIPRVIHFWEI